MIKIIEINELKEGDVVTEPIYNALGHVLLPANYVINQSSLKLLKTLNIKNVSIKREDELESEEISEEIVQSVLDKLIEEIGWKPENDYELELLKIKAIHKLKNQFVNND